MKRVAHTPQLGTLWWIKNNVKERIDSAFGSIEEYRGIGDWNSIDLTVPPKAPTDYQGKEKNSAGTTSFLKKKGCLHEATQEDFNEKIQFN